MSFDSSRLMLRMKGCRDVEVKWYNLSCVNDDQVRALFLRALGLRADANLICRDPKDESVVALCSALPSEQIFDAELQVISPKTSNIFRTRLVKFEKIQAHLANERTWLAWVRTALSSLSISFSLLAFVRDYGTQRLAVPLFALGSGFVASVFTMFITGWLRYLKVRDALMLMSCRFPANLHRVGLGHQSCILFILFVSLTITYLLFARKI